MNEINSKIYGYIAMVVAIFTVLFLAQLWIGSHPRFKETEYTIPYKREDSPLPKVKSEIKIDTVRKVMPMYELMKLEPDSSYFKALYTVYQTEDALINQSAPYRKDVIIRYYYKSADDSVVFGLNDLRFYVHVRPAEMGSENLQSNAIYYGDDASKMDIVLSAFYLLKNQIPLKKIEYSKYGDDWKSRAIEIGTDTTLLSAPTLTFDQLITFHKNN